MKSGRWVPSLSFWSARSAREKILMAVLIVVLIATSFVEGLWRPLNNARDRLEERVAHIGALTTRLQTLPVVATPAARSTDPRSLAALLSASAADAGLPILRLQPEQETVDVTLGDANFITILDWIDGLERTNGVRVVMFDMTRRPEPGLVGATMTVRN